jgi:hypothetical protein
MADAQIEVIVRRALEEDMGDGDVTTRGSDTGWRQPLQLQSRGHSGRGGTKPDAGDPTGENWRPF